MAIFDIEKDELLRLSDTQLEELIARLAEAEVAAYGYSPACVSWSGSINAPDGGIDIHVKLPVGSEISGFLERPATIFQAKKHSMPKSGIAQEMLSKGKLSGTISKLALTGGSYIIVSLADDCSPPMKRERIEAMREAVKDDPSSSNIHLDFYDRSRLVQWLRQHPSIMLWVKGKLGQGYTGWQPYGAWSNPPQGADDSLILAAGVVVTLPSGKGQKLKVEDAINPMRDLIRSTNKSIRITGLSGVGKTRIVQALFDETVGLGALDRTAAVYVDTGADPDPSATAMLDKLIAKNHRAIMVLDNCPSDLHAKLAGKVSTNNGKVSLITIEYDIRDDKPQTTEVIHIEAIGSEVAELLLIRRFPSIGHTNAQRIAAFADGNARVALAIAERVEEGESLARLSDEQLFNRLFEQRNHPDNDLKEQAELLSLVYSFSVKDPEVGLSELDVLSSISEYSKDRLFRSVNKLLSRHVIQKRAHWRAILPHAIANRLAVSALNSIPVNKLRATFEAPSQKRLLMSFAHRLGLLHDHPVAKEIVEAWLQPEGLLGSVLALDDMGVRMLDYVAPVAPEALLDRLEAVLTASEFEGMNPRHNPRRVTILNLLQSLAYEPIAFERCLRLLILVADNEDENNNYDAVRSKIVSFFQAYLSGTHASLGQRLAILNECFSSGIAVRRALGFRMLSTALSGGPWTGLSMREFGARPRDFGLQPNHEELVEWRSAFIDVAVQLGTSGDSNLEEPARLTLANMFRGIWYQEAMRGKLVEAAYRLNTHRSWGEGWKAVRSTIYFDYSGRKNKGDPELLPDSLAALGKELEPCDLIPTIMTYVLSHGDYWALDTDFNHADPRRYSGAEERLKAKALRLGEEFVASNHKFDELGPNLFAGNGLPYRASFGRGLAKGADDIRVSWQQLVDQLEKHSETGKNFAIFCGFIEEVNSVDPATAQELLDQCAQHSELRRELVGLHPWQTFTEIDLDRCMAILDDPDVQPWMYEPILWRDDYADLPKSRVLNLAQRLLSKPNGDDVVLNALSLRLHGTDGVVDTLGSELRSVGLRAATQRLQRGDSTSSESVNDAMECVVVSVLRFEGNEAEKQRWLDAILAVIDDRYGYIDAFGGSIEATIGLMPEEFLKRVFEGSAEQQSRRQFCVRNSKLLTKVDMDALISWCSAQHDARAWTVVAAGIDPWEQNKASGDDFSLSQATIRLLEACPDPQSVLKVFAKSIEFLPWSNSRVSMALPRAEAIHSLSQHSCVQISKAAQSIFAELAIWIEHEKLREQQEGRGFEQRFE